MTTKTTSQSHFDLTDAEQRRVSFVCRSPRGREHMITVAPPCMAQMLAVVRMEPDDPEAETTLQRLDRDYRSALVMCLPPFPRAWWERLPWYLARWRVARFLRALSYPRLALLINNLAALAQGVTVDVLEQMADTAPQRTPAEREQALNEIIAAVAAEMNLPPREVSEMPAHELAILIDQVGKKLEREEEWRQAIAGVRGA